MVPIIDAHTHFFDPARPAGVPWPAADDEVLYRTTLPEHFRAVASPHGVHRTVVVEASAWLEDNQWILDLAARDSDRSIVGFVGHIEPDDPDYTSHLDRFCANPLFRGLRLSSALVDGPRDALVEACRELLQRDLSVDLLVNGEQLSVVAELCAALPDLHVVLDHVAHVAIDAHWNYPPVDILKVAHRLEGLDLLWLEDPIPPENVAAMRELKQQTTLLICTGENFYTTHGFRELVQTQAADIICPDLAKAGGLAEGKRIAELGELYYLPMAPHNVCGPVGTYAAAHVCAAVPNFLVLEYHFHLDENWPRFVVPPETGDSPLGPTAT